MNKQRGSQCQLSNCKHWNTATEPCDAIIELFLTKIKATSFLSLDWMARTFFTGGCMPSHSLMLNFQERVVLERQWGVSGSHYAKTLDNWLDRMDDNKDVVEKILRETYGEMGQSLSF